LTVGANAESNAVIGAFTMTGSREPTELIRKIPSHYASKMDPPLLRRALNALLEKQLEKFYQASVDAMLHQQQSPDRKDFDLDRLERLVNELANR